MQDRIIVDYDSISHDLEGMLEELRVIRADKIFNQAMGQNNIQKMRDYETAVKKRLYEAFNMVVIGDFKRGKSTLVNAILGKNVVPTAVTPETVTINRISYAEIPRIEAVLKNGKKARISSEELKRESLENIIRQLPSTIEYIDVRENAEVLKEICVVDTPGVGDLLKEFDDQVADYLVNADAVLFVISARSPLSQTEQNFMGSAVIPQSFSRVFVVINMIDSLETEENIEKIKNLIKSRAQNISPHIYVYAVSALDEVCRKEGLRRPEPELNEYLERSFAEFAAALKQDILEQKEIIKSTRAVTLMNNMLRDTNGRIKLIQSTLEMSIETLLEREHEYQNQNSELMQSIEQYKQQLANDIDSMKTEAYNWVGMYLQRLHGELEMARAQTDTAILARHLQFFLMDMIKQGILICVDSHQQAIDQRISQVSESFASDVARSAFGNIDSQVSGSIKEVAWTGVDSMMLVGDVLQLEKVLGPIYLLGSVVAGFFRQRKVESNQEDFVKPLLENYGNIATEVGNKVLNVYDEIKRKALSQVDELYQIQIQISLDAIRQAKEVVQSEDVKVDEVVAYLNEILNKIDEMQVTIEKYE